MNVRDFLRKNGLKQVQLARYLDVTEAAISNVANGKSEFSEENLIKIMNNPHGWDVSMLTERQPEVSAEEQPAAGGSLIEYLQRKVKELERENADLLQENAVLKYENRMLASDKKEGAGSAAGSLSVTA